MEKTDKIVVDLTPSQSSQQIKFTNHGEQSGKVPGNKTCRDNNANHKRIGSNCSRKDFISRNKDIVKLLSARSKERKTSTQIGMIEDLVETPTCEIVIHPKLKEPSFTAQI